MLSFCLQLSTHSPHGRHILPARSSPRCCPLSLSCALPMLTSTTLPVASSSVIVPVRLQVRLERDIKRKLDLKWAAFHCLPSLERKKEALQINPFVPLYRKVATALPPIHGFGGPAGADAGADALAAGAGSSASAASAAAAGSAAPAKAGAGAGSAAPAAGASAGAAGKGKPGAAAAGGAGAPAGAAAGAGKEAPKKPANVNAESLLNRRSGQSDDSELLGMSSAPVAAPAAPAKKEAAPAPEVGKKKKK